MKTARAQREDNFIKNYFHNFPLPTSTSAPLARSSTTKGFYLLKQFILLCRLPVAIFHFRVRRSGNRAVVVAWLRTRKRENGSHTLLHGVHTPQTRKARLAKRMVNEIITGQNSPLSAVGGGKGWHSAVNYEYQITRRPHQSQSNEMKRVTEEM